MASDTVGIFNCCNMKCCYVNSYGVRAALFRGVPCKSVILQLRALKEVPWLNDIYVNAPSDGEKKLNFSK